jgi:hypothetical protein
LRRSAAWEECGDDTWRSIGRGALCTFPGKPQAAAEFARVLRPGGRAGITDVTAAPDRLPPELTGVATRIACVADARPLDEYAAILAAAALRTVRTERHDQAMARMIDQIEARLNLLRPTVAPKLAPAGIGQDAAPALLAAARAALLWWGPARCPAESDGATQLRRQESPDA